MNWVNYQHEQYTAYLSEKEAQARHEHLAQEARSAARQVASVGVLERLTHWITGDAN